MESLLFLWYLTPWLLFFLLAPQAVQTTLPRMLSSPGEHIVGYTGRAVNFTWTFSNQTLIDDMYFGTWEKNNFQNSIVCISQLENGTSTVDIKQDRSVLEYSGRIRWAGDVSIGLAIFELSGIKSSDERTYDLEIFYKDYDETELNSKTKLIVKDTSQFVSSRGLVVSHNRGEKATFSWSYKLTEDDTKALSQVVFGVYKGGSYKPICVYQVESKQHFTNNCSTGVTKSASHIEAINPQSKATFVLNNIELEDEAVYSIRLVGTTDDMESKTRLVVTVPPRIIERPKNTTILEGRNLKLKCVVEGKPKPTIKWLKDNETLEGNSTKYFTKPGIKRQDAGHYQCVAENKVGRIVSEPKAIVNVQYPPVINSSKKINIIPVPIGTDVWLSCRTVANPPASVLWLANGILVKRDSENVHVTLSRSFDYANYTCVANNLVGQDNNTFVLAQVGPPSNPQVDCDKKGDASLDLTFIFHWSSPKKSGGAPVFLYTIKHRSFVKASQRNTQAWKSINVTHKRTWYKFKLKWQRTFEYTITAWNKYGESTLDIDNTCLITVGKDTRIFTIMPTQDIVAAAAKKNSNNHEPIKNLWLYVGVGAGVLGLALLVLLIYSYRKRRKAKKDNWYIHHTSFNAFTMESNMLEGASVNSHLLQADTQSGTIKKQSMVGSPRYQMDPEWFIPREKICIVKVIGNGAFGLVYKGRVHGFGPNTLGWNLVAIKSPYADASDAEVKDLMKEFELMKTLKPHPHVIKLLGCGEDEGRPLVIIEYVPFGDLLGYLRKSRGENDDYYSDPEIKPNTNLTSQQLIRFAWHTADGMAYLASQKILHRDLAARNVLVGDGLSCKVTDFGMAKDVSNDDIYIRSTEGRLPVKWTAIEALTGGGEYTTQSDVWSFGVVLYEICTIGAEPFPGVAAKEIPLHIVEGYRMKRPGHVDPELYDIMMSCWETNPDDRPTFPELKETLMKLEEVQSRDYINLKECRQYQNVPVTPSTRRAGKRDLGTLKGSVRGNPYHIGPGTQGQVTAV